MEPVSDALAPLSCRPQALMTEAERGAEGVATPTFVLGRLSAFRQPCGGGSSIVPIL